MKAEQKNRARNSILGALVADAATMGFHWLYSQRRIRDVAPDNPEFHAPDARDFEGNVGYFAHGHKQAGELSHYGEQMLVMLKSLAGNQGRYEKHDYEEQFRSHFGYGGAFHGYIDRPTRETLDNLYRAEADALAQANALPFAGDSKLKQTILVKILAAAKRADGEALKEAATALARSLPDPASCLDYALALVESLSGSADYHGAIDEQLPAISKLPPLVACHADDEHLDELITSAVRVTNDTPRAIDYGQVCGATLQACIQGKSLPEAIEIGLSAASDETREHLRLALSRSATLDEVTREFGLHCDLGSGMASILSNLNTATSYEHAIRRNLYAGGDNCGRAIMLGAACGAFFGREAEPGIPEAWIEKLAGREKILPLIDQLI
jgi:ADP-ribosylglycohydrolase